MQRHIKPDVHISQHSVQNHRRCSSEMMNSPNKTGLLLPIASPQLHRARTPMSAESGCCDDSIVGESGCCDVPPTFPGLNRPTSYGTSQPQPNKRMSI